MSAAVRGALAIVGVACAVIYLAVYDIEPLLPRVLVKPVPILCLATWVGLAARGWTGRLVVLGLLASAAGDVVLMGEGDGFFVGGLVCFLVAHLLYIAAFVVEVRRPAPLRALPFLAFALFVFLFLLPGLGSMVPPVAVYCLAIAAMGWRAAARVGAGTAPVGIAWIGVAGAALFIVSDSMIAVRSFHAPFPGAGLAIMVTYYLGQLGIAWSVAFSEPGLPDTPRSRRTSDGFPASP